MTRTDCALGEEEDGRPAAEAHPNDDTAVVRVGHTTGPVWQRQDKAKYRAPSLRSG